MTIRRISGIDLEGFRGTIMERLEHLLVYLTTGTSGLISLGVVVCLVSLLLCVINFKHRRYRGVVFGNLIFSSILLVFLVSALFNYATQEVSLDRYAVLLQQANADPEVNRVVAEYIRDHDNNLDGFQYAVLSKQVKDVS